MIDYITYRRTNVSSLEVLILKAIAITIIAGLFSLQLLVSNV
ncbi:MAG: hypothetical protein AB9846_01915 [Tenuifilaceae bacterium]